MKRFPPHPTRNPNHYPSPIPQKPELLRKPARLAAGPTFFLSTLCLWLVLLFPPPPACQAADSLLEELSYQVDVMFWKKAVQAKLTFSSLGNGRYRAEISGEAQGLLRLITGQWRGSFVTEMEWHNGQLRPVLYREEGKSWGKRHLYEYRFAYDKAVLELHQWQDGQGLVKKWETPLDRPTYDFWTVLYNLRLGLCGPLKAGETLRFNGIPYPKPEEIAFAVGGTGPAGRKVMISLVNRIFADENNCLFVYFNGDEVPTSGWTRVLQFGKVTWKLLPESKTLIKGRLNPTASPP